MWSPPRSHAVRNPPMSSMSPWVLTLLLPVFVLSPGVSPSVSRCQEPTNQCLPCSLVPTSTPSLSCRQRSANRFQSPPPPTHPPWYPPSDPFAVMDTPCSFLRVSWGLRLTPLQPRIHQSLPDLLGSPLRSTVVRNPPISSTSSPPSPAASDPPIYMSAELSHSSSLPFVPLLSGIHQSPPCFLS